MRLPRRPFFITAAPTAGDNRRMQATVEAYIAAIPPARRPLFDRLHALVLSVHPEAAVVTSYGMPTFKVGKRRLHLAAWSHGISIYGVQEDRDGGFTARHPELRIKGTLKFGEEAAALISDQEFTELFRAALAD